MSGYNRSCSSADSSILLAAQWAAAFSMMPASAPSCWGAGGYGSVIQGICHLGFSVGWNFMRETIGEARSVCQQPGIRQRRPKLTAGGVAAIDCEIRDALMEIGNGDIAAEAIP